MKKIIWANWIAMILLSMPIMSVSNAADYRIGYFESHQQQRYENLYQTLLKNIKKRGWENLFEFPPAAHISVGSEKAEEKLNQAAKALLQRKDIDAIIVMGTTATRAIINNNDGRLPIFSEVVTDAIKEGFVNDENDSGQDNFTVSVAPERYKNMFRVFHDEISFKVLGLMYFNHAERNKDTNADDADLVAQEKEFLVTQYSLADHQAQDNIEGCLEGLKSLLKKGMSAFFVPSLQCFKEDQATKNKPLMNFLLTNKIPTFARLGTVVVKNGALMGFSEDYHAQGKTLADKLFAVLVKKEKPRNLPMLDNSSPKVVLNLAVAQQIGRKLSFDILGACDEIYQEVYSDQE